MSPRQTAGLGALLVAGCYLTGIAFVLGPLAPLGLGTGAMDGAAVLQLTRQSPWLLPLWMTVIYDLSALGTALAGLGLARALARDLPHLALASAATALIWTGLTLASGMVARAGLAELAALAPQDLPRALETWRILHLIETGLSGRTEALGGLWIGLASFAALRIGALSGVAGLLGAGVALAGLATYLPPLSQGGGMVFGLGAILWCGWAGVEWILPRPAET
ncbi:hypothetical protein [Dinoroseobacter sp. S124A]|uniref:hypothetical protein n=1 Tax=Dinoroseobacter sp. S124A TaxID=3415128 RepID=UPI003C79928C